MLKCAVTGAYGYSGKYIARRFLNAGHEVITLTNSPGRPNAFGNRVVAKPLTFENIDTLTTSLMGVDVLVNTYWVRFNHPKFKQADAVANTKVLFEAASLAGVRRVVHFSITNPSPDSPLEYFRSKAILEQCLKNSGISYAILRPAILFGKEDILINNIAWVLRHVPVFGICGDGQYKVQPIHVDDMAALAVEQSERTTDVIIDAIGPETFTFREMVAVIGALIGKPRPIISLPPSFVWLAAQVIGRVVGDVMLTKPEIEGLMGNLLYTSSSPAGRTRLTDWVSENKQTLGTRYASEMARRLDRNLGYNKECLRDVDKH